MSEEVSKLKQLTAMEKNHATELLSSVGNLRNVVIKATLEGISHDSRKHAGFYRAVVNLLGVAEPAITTEDYERLEEVISKHIEVEERMMREAKQLLNNLSDMRMKHLLQEIYDDEVKHHALMKRILESVVRREAIFEEDWWDAMWKEVPGHGAPLGS